MAERTAAVVKPADILKRLEPPVRPGLSAGSAAAPVGPRGDGAPVEAASFEQLITRARGGAWSGLPRITLPSGLELNESQQRRLDLAAEQAQAAGSRRSLVLLDGMALILDVPQRAVAEQIDSTTDADRVVADIDSVVATRRDPVDAQTGDARSTDVLKRLDAAAWPATVRSLLDAESASTQAMALSAISPRRPKRSAAKPV